MTMRILRIAQKLYPDVIGGGPYHVHALSRDQAAMGHEVTVATVATDPSLPAVDERDGYSIRRFPAIASPLGNAISPALIRFLRTTDDYDVVHAHSHLYSSTVAAALRRVIDNTPLVITNHGLYSQSAPKALFELYLRTIGRMTFEAADTVFCYTAVDKKRLRDRGVTNRIDVIANGIDIDRFTPEGPSLDRVDDTAPTILFVGRLVAGKRPDTVIDTLSVVRSAIPNAQLLICGDGPLRTELTTRVSDESLGEAVEFLGRVSYEQMPAVYRSADVLILPSESEGFPRTVLEALATGLPVVTSNLPQLMDVVEGVGQTVSPTPAALGEAITKLLSDEHLRGRYGQTGRERIEKEFDWERTVDETTGVLQELATR